MLTFKYKLLFMFNNDRYSLKNNEVPIVIISNCVSNQWASTQIVLLCLKKVYISVSEHDGEVDSYVRVITKNIPFWLNIK